MREQKETETIKEALDYLHNIIKCLLLTQFQYFMVIINAGYWQQPLLPEQHSKKKITAGLNLRPMYLALYSHTFRMYVYVYKNHILYLK